MSLDVFAPAIAASDQNVVANAAADLPADFAESFDISQRGVSEFGHAQSYTLARERALVDYNDDVYQKTGERLPWLGVGPEDASLDQFNEAQAKLQQKVPGLDYLTPLSEGDIDAMTLRRMAKAHADAAAFQHRETSWSGTAGTVLGTFIGGLTDPVLAATQPLMGAGELGIALRALEFAGISGGSEAVSAGIGYGSREAAVPGSGKEIPGEIVNATLSGVVFGGAFGLLGKLLGAGAKTLPTTVRDEVNAATSEFQFHATNPFPTAAGESAARDATVDATTSLAKGETVTAADNFEARHVADYALAARADTPEALALAGEQHLRPETFSEVPDVERFDRMPAEHDDAASYWDKRLETASPEERQALGATDARAVNLVEQPDAVAGAMQKVYAIHGPAGEDLGSMVVTKMGDVARIENIEVAEGSNALGASNMRSLLRQFREANPEIRELTGERISGARFGGQEVYDGEHVSMRLPEIPARDLTPEQVTKLAADPATDSAVLHNLEHIMADKPDMEFSTQIRQPDGSYTLETRKLSDVLAEIDGLEAAAKEIEACAVGVAMAAE